MILLRASVPPWLISRGQRDQERGDASGSGILFAFVAQVMCGCISSADLPVTDDGEVAPVDAGASSAPDDLTSASAAACDSYQGIVDAGVIALTPRANRLAEILALEAGGGFVASQDLFEQVDLDLGMIPIFDQLPPGTAISSRWSEGIRIDFDAEGAHLVEMGEYSAWDCVNQYYKGQWYGSLRRVMFDGVYDEQQLVEELLALPHVTHAYRAEVVGDASDTCLAIAGDVRLYIVDVGKNDCLNGCGQHTLHVFVSDADGVVELGSFTTAPQLPTEFLGLAKTCAENLTSDFYQHWFEEKG